ncbi:YCII-related domain-containing protein [Nocardioides exalbidus]|uniref:YCII-related domain-containing protein n=1 Tax=Nocardioides exalbidus TaxID=402596 RepID=A0A1H4P171_9ACTN|nr:YciI family protein [Nocardioides exalbidus]SEC01084.1 YCII-related domain-containing protein [Nocardioides exalbidus]
MHYLLTVIGDTDNPTDDSAPGAVDAFNDRLKDEGRWVFAGGLTGPEDATVTDNRSGTAILTDGPFVESKEFLAGFWVVTADDLDQALALSVDASQACHRKIEVRPFDGVA